MGPMQLDLIPGKWHQWGQELLAGGSRCCAVLSACLPACQEARFRAQHVAPHILKIPFSIS